MWDWHRLIPSRLDTLHAALGQSGIGHRHGPRTLSNECGDAHTDEVGTSTGRRVQRAHYAAITLLLAACSTGTSSGSTSMQVQVEQVTLDVSIGSKDGPTIATASFWIGADGTPRGTAFLKDAAEEVATAIALPAARNRLLIGEASDQVCAESYGGPDVATVTGSIGGHRVATSFNRANGCGLADWKLLEPLIGRPRWDVDRRVIQRDETSVEVRTGDLFSIELASNATTGYGWQSMIADEATLREVDHRYLATSTTLVGAGGYERFTYEATAPGDATLEYEYRRPSEPGATPAADTARFGVHISAPAPDGTSSATTTISMPSNSSDPSATVLPANEAGTLLIGFVGAVRSLHEGIQPLLAEAAGVSAGAVVPPSVSQHATEAVDQFYALPAMIPDVLNPALRAAAVDVLFALGRELAPFLFAPGWEPDGWEPWASGVEDAQVDVPETVAQLVDAASLHPATEPRDEGGADAAAFHGGLDVVLVRGFGHANFNTQPPWSVRWIGDLPADPTAPCFTDGHPPAGGAFADHLGGCAVLYYDTSDPATHDSELTSWLADPAAVPTFSGEVITIRWTNGEWVGIGSAE